MLIQVTLWSLMQTEWILRQGKRSQGLSVSGWAEEIKKLAGIRWSQLTYDRVQRVMWRDQSN